MTEKLETEIIRAEKHCVSCLHWDAGGWSTSRTRRFSRKRKVGDEEVKKVASRFGP